jgi:L-fuculose-phosphate aldolase
MRSKSSGRTNFQTFFVSQEPSRCPRIPALIKVGKRLAKQKLTSNAGGDLSVRFGRRVVITTAGADLGLLSSNDFVEVVDFDFSRVLAVIIGSNPPSPELPLHWLIYNAFDDIQAVVQTCDEEVLKLAKKRNDLPQTQERQPCGSFELARETLKVLRHGKHVILKQHGIISVGNTLDEAYKETIECHQTMLDSKL